MFVSNLRPFHCIKPRHPSAVLTQDGFKNLVALYTWRRYMERRVRSDLHVALAFALLALTGGVALAVGVIAGLVDEDFDVQLHGRRLSSV